MKIQYKKHRFNRATYELIWCAEEIAREYMDQDLRLTLRQLYYQFVSRDLLSNTQQSYKRLGSVITDARNAGVFDWDVIEDRTRNLVANSHWDSPKEILESVAEQFRYDLWEDQHTRVEVWIEKEALAGVFSLTCRRLDVPVFACRGYPSASEVWSAGQRFMRFQEASQGVVVLHFGDHDPSGIDMTRDLKERLNLYARGGVQIERIALNYMQIERFRPPPNPAKTTDSRFASYVTEYGSDSWELDALEPKALNKLVEESVKKYRDEDQWRISTLCQDEARGQLHTIAENYGHFSG